MHAPAALVIIIDPRTFFDQKTFDAKQGVSADPLNASDPGGLLVRDPAVGFIQKRTPAQSGGDASTLRPLVSKTQDGSGPWFFDLSRDVSPPCGLPTLVSSDGSSDGDNSSRTAVSMPQLGRPLVYDAHSALFEDASLSVMAR